MKFGKLFISFSESIFYATWNEEHDKVLALMRAGSPLEEVKEAIKEVHNLNVFQSYRGVSLSGFGDSINSLILTE